ncbi:MAG TPA: hypothetical protein VN372_09095 [Methanospirillum sp.]|nr:hypothetical protein [Methanospirillum sp.]
MYVIKGGAGFVGSHLAKRVSANHELEMVDTLFCGKREKILGLPVTSAQESITVLEFLTDIYGSIRDLSFGINYFRASFI